MINKRTKGLFMVLRAMETKERILFRKYLDFAPFNGSAKVVQLYDLIVSAVLETESMELNYADFVPEDIILNSQVEKVSSHLHQKLDHFLAMQEVESSPSHYAAYTLAAYERLLPGSPLLDKQYKKIRKRLQAEPSSNASLSALAQLEHHYLPRRIATGSKEDNSYFIPSFKHREADHLLWRLIYTCASINESRLLNRPWPAQMIAELAPYREILPKVSFVLTRAYFCVFEVLEAKEISMQMIRDSIHFLESNRKYISIAELGDMFQYLLNASFREIDRGNIEFEVLSTEIYRRLLDYGLLTQQERMHPHVYKNIVSAHCRTAEFSWCNQFIEEYKTFLPESQQSFLPDYARGLVHFYQDQFQDSARIFRTIVQKDPDGLFWGFESRNLLLKSLFMLDQDLMLHELDELLRLVKSFKVYVQRNQSLSTYHRKCYLNFAVYFGQLMKLRDKKLLKGPQALELWERIEQEKFVTHKQWLREILKPPKPSF